MLLTLTSSLLVLATSSAQSSTPWDTLLSDVNTWTQEESMLEEDLRSESQDEVFHTATDLFPAEGAGAASSVASSASSVSRPSVLSILVDGVSVQLQDVPLDAWFAPFVRGIAERSLISGYRDSAGRPTGFFGPGDSVTIGQLAKVLVQAADIDTASCTATPLNPSAIGHWSASFLSCAEREQWTLFTDVSLNVERPATRSEVVGTLFEALGVRPVETQKLASTVSPFTDVRVSSPFASAIIQAQKNGIIQGYKDAQGNLLHLFGPRDSVTRAEFSKIVVGGLEAYGK